MGKKYCIWEAGVVTEWKPGYAKVKLVDDDIVTTWLQINYGFTFGSKQSWPLKVNTQVQCLMAEDMVEGVIIGCTYNDEDIPPSEANANTFVTKFEDGTIISYNKSTHELLADVKGKVKITATNDIEATSSTNVKAKATIGVTLEAPVITLKGNVSILGVLAAGGMSIAPVTGPTGPTDGKVNGDIEIIGNIKAINVQGINEVIAGTIPLKTHKHNGVTTGTGISGTPTP